MNSDGVDGTAEVSDSIIDVSAFLSDCDGSRYDRGQTGSSVWVNTTSALSADN